MSVRFPILSADTMSSDSTIRFSNRVADYVRYRPSYPGAVVDTLRTEAGLRPDSTVADIGSGTGISAALFLQLGCTVHGIEPNLEMRTAAETQFANEPRFHSRNGTAEATTLPDAAVDLVAAGQAFHWFDRTQTRAEFVRILRKAGYAALFWNSRRTTSTPFLIAYETLLNDFATDYREVNHTNIDRNALAEFFGGPFESRTFPNAQDFDFEGLKGRLLSSSYAPAAGHPRHDAMLQELRRLFDRHAANGTVRFEYDTELYFGRLP